MANISRITDRLWTGGDLPCHIGPDAMVADLADITAAGITHIIDNRLEEDDGAFVAEHAPTVTYVWNGQDDAGQQMPDRWFDAGVGAALEALVQPGTAVLSHCHMGINRGPSMAFAIMLATGWAPAEALSAIRRARPIAAIDYSENALDWWLRASGTPYVSARRQLAELALWHADHPIDVVRIIRRERSAEFAGLPLGA